MPGPKGTKKNRKKDRNRVKCSAYRTALRGERNQARRLITHLRRYGYTAVADAPEDVQAAWRKLVALLPNAVLRTQELRLQPPEPAIANGE